MEFSRVHIVLKRYYFKNKYFSICHSDQTKKILLRKYVANFQATLLFLCEQAFTLTRTPHVPQPFEVFRNTYCFGLCQMILNMFLIESWKFK